MGAKDIKEEANKNSGAAVTKKKPRLSIVKKILLGIVLFIAAIFIIVTLTTAGAAKVSNEFVDDILSGDSSSAYQLFSSEAKQAVPEDEFNQAVERLDSALEDSASQKSKEIKGQTGESSTSTITYEVNGSDGTYTLTVNLVKEDGDWKVQHFNSTLKK